MGDKIVVEIDKDLEEIMPGFLENRKKDIVSLDQFIADNDIQNIEVIGHKLAGNAGGYGLPDLGNIGAAIEKAAQNSNIEEIKTLVQDFKNYMSDLEIKYV